MSPSVQKLRVEPKSLWARVDTSRGFIWDLRGRELPRTRSGLGSRVACNCVLLPFLIRYTHATRSGISCLRVEPAGELIQRIKRLYDRDARGWNVLGAPDQAGKLDLFISHRGPEVWQLKSKAVNPMEFMSLGVEVTNVDVEIRKRLAQSGSPFVFQAVFPQADSGAIIAQGLGIYSPESTHEIKRLVSQREGNVDEELARRLDDLFRKAHREKASMHV